MQETDRPLETSADHLNQAPGLNKEEVANRCACPRPAVRVDRGGIFRSATLCGGYVTVRAQPQPQE